MPRYLFALMIFIQAIAGAESEKIRVVPVNIAEAVFAPFWDITMGELNNWALEGDISQTWCYVKLEWPGKAPLGKAAVKMTRKGPVDCSGYDKLLIAINLPPGTILKVDLKTDKMNLSGEWTVKRSSKEEYELGLNGASKIEGISLAIYPDRENVQQSGWISWIGFRNSRLMEDYKTQWKKFAEQPLDVFLAPTGTVPSFTPRFGLVANAEEIEIAREYLQKLSPQDAASYFTINKDIKPETYIREFMSVANPKMFARPTDYEIPMLRVKELAEAGIVRKNSEALRLAAKTAVAIALSPNWDAGFTIFFPGSTFDQMPFSQAMISYELAVVLDLGWDMFSPAGRGLIMRRLALDGIGTINYDTWRNSYIFSCNQMAAFSSGRIASYMAMEKQNYWTHVKPYSDLAYKELCESINNIVLPDGGFKEGTAYLQYTISSAVPAFAAYAGARGLKLKDIVPEKLKKLANYAEVFISTDRRGGLIPFSSSQAEGRQCAIDAISFMSALCPDSQWVKLFHDRTQGKMPKENLLVWTLAEKIPAQIPETKNFAKMPQMCVISSTRQYRGKTVKLVLFGGAKEFPGHQHEDRGSFVLEFGGDTYAMDPGGKDYSESGAEEIKHCQFHNMLIPTGTQKRPHAVIPAPQDIRPDGNGSAKDFNAFIAPSAAWAKYYKKWTRRINSPTPDIFEISDEYELSEGNGVDFIWMTQLPAKIDESSKTITLTGEDTYAVIGIPSSAHAEAEELPLRNGKMNKIKIHIDGIKNKVDITVKLKIKE